MNQTTERQDDGDMGNRDTDHPTGGTEKAVEAWPRCPEAARFFDDQFTAFSHANVTISALASHLHDHAGVDPRTLIDHWIFPREPEVLTTLELCGLRAVTIEGEEVWEHPAGRLPRVRTAPEIYCPRLALAVEDIDAFLSAHDMASTARLGDPDSEYEEAHCPVPHGELVVVARRGYRGFRPGHLDTTGSTALARARRSFDERDRGGDEADAIRRASDLFASAASTVGLGRAVDEFFASERRFYMTRNSAARWQYERQQDLGLGWANHDHHTYRSSRDSFRNILELWDRMGFIARERFYAGADAGWGAQVLEHPISRVVIFCDVDMTPEELNIDLLHTDLTPTSPGGDSALTPGPSPELARSPLGRGENSGLGTIGLWCALHGSSIGAAGMHHLECEFDFSYANTLLTSNGHPTMKPFTDLPMLKQAFTQPEMWPIAPERLDALVAAGHITAEDRARFEQNGAAGSHLEVLQRWDGFKGFNKTGISSIIRETDARRIGEKKAA